MRIKKRGDIIQNTYDIVPSPDEVNLAKGDPKQLRSWGIRPKKGWKNVLKEKWEGLDIRQVCPQCNYLMSLLVDSNGDVSPVCNICPTRSGEKTLNAMDGYSILELLRKMRFDGEIPPVFLDSLDRRIFKVDSGQGLSSTDESFMRGVLKRVQRINKYTTGLDKWLVYLISDGVEFVKIGFTNDLKGRLMELQVGNPRDLEIIAVVSS